MSERLDDIAAQKRIEWLQHKAAIAPHGQKKKRWLELNAAINADLKRVVSMKRRRR